MGSLTHTGEPGHPLIRQAAVISLGDSSQVAVARRAAHEAGSRLALDLATLARAEIVAVELANNILQHTRTPAETVASPPPSTVRRIVRPGEIFISSTTCGTGIQIVAVDTGPGILNIQRALEDGFSTSHTPGNGLGAVQRLSRQFDVFSIPAAPSWSATAQPNLQGTVISAIVGPPVNSRAFVQNACSPAVLSTALPGETFSGDSWAILESPGNDDHILLVDGLGHGQYAHEAATLAVQLFFRFAQVSPGGPARPMLEILQQMHQPMHATRGAAIAILRIDRRARVVYFCGVGNISAVLASAGQTRSMVSHNGTIGHQMPRVQEFPYPYTPDTLLIAHSDGIVTSWKLSGYPGLDRHPAATIAGVLYRDAWRGRDDATILVTRLD